MGVIAMNETFSSLKVEIKKGLLPKVDYVQQIDRSVRPFRQKFCKLARESKGLTKEELCAELNSHPDILKLEKLPGYKYFYPITPDLLEKLENEITKIVEYQPYSMGWLAPGLCGTPTKDIAGIIARVCGVTKFHREIEQLSLQYEFGTDVVASWGR